MASEVCLEDDERRAELHDLIAHICYGTAAGWQPVFDQRLQQPKYVQPERVRLYQAAEVGMVILCPCVVEEIGVLPGMTLLSGVLAIHGQCRALLHASKPVRGIPFPGKCHIHVQIYRLGKVERSL